MQRMQRAARSGGTFTSTSEFQAHAPSSDPSIPNNPKIVKYAHELYEAVRREFPELRVYRVSKEENT
jgi:hypothetical protein